MATRRLLQPISFGALAVLAGCGGRGGDPTRPATTPRAATSGVPERLRDAPCPDVPDLPGFRCARLDVPLHRRGPGASATATR